MYIYIYIYIYILVKFGSRFFFMHISLNTTADFAFIIFFSIFSTFLIIVFLVGCCQ